MDATLPLPASIRPPLRYWLVTGPLVAWMTAGGVAALVGVEAMTDRIALLGYPPYFATLLGAAKLIGAALLALPVPRPLKHLAYAGLFFEVTAAALSYAASGMPARDVAVPLVFLALVGASYAAFRHHPPTPDGPPEATPSGFRPDRVRDRGFVRLYRTLRVTPRTTARLAAEVAAERIGDDEDLYLIDGGGERVAVRLRSLAYHHLAEVDVGRPLLLTFCTVCSSGSLFDPVLDGRLLHFAVAGVYRGTMLMRDTETGSEWDHMTGEALSGPLQGQRLAIVGAHRVLSAHEALRLFPDLRVATDRLPLWQKAVAWFQARHSWRTAPEGKFYPGFRDSFVWPGDQADTRRPEKELGLGLWGGSAPPLYVPLTDVPESGREITWDGRRVLIYRRETGTPSAIWLGDAAWSYDGDGLHVDGRRLTGDYFASDDEPEAAPQPSFLFTRWYGFAQTFPACDVLARDVLDAPDA